MVRLSCAGLSISLLLASSAARAQSEPEPPPPVEPWYDAFDFRAFADAYASVNYGFPKPADRGNSATRAYDLVNGFSLSWVGLDASYDPDPVGGTVALRFGPSATRYSSACFATATPFTAPTPCDEEAGLGMLKQAYASWKPGGPEGRLRLDFGKFDTVYGAELAESQANPNYTRGVLYWWAQPSFHTGLRANVELSPEVSFNILAVNGYNNTVDNNTGKTFGVQLAWQPSDSFGAWIGWLGGPEQNDVAVLACDAGEAYDPTIGACAPSATAPTEPSEQVVDQGDANGFDSWRHLVDLVVAFAPAEDLSLVINADAVFEGVRELDAATLQQNVENKMLWGAMLAARYQLDETFAVAGRGEYLDDADGLAGFGSTGFSIATGTLTLEAAPTENLILRLEQRGDFALTSDTAGGKEIFPKGERETAESMHTTTLGVVVTTN